MPLKAIVDGKTIIAPDLSDEEWKDLKLRHAQGLPVTMACCGGAGHLRTSKAGTPHFYHAVDAGCHYEEESREHLEIKYQVYRICTSEGWETFVEYPAPDRTWIADVCAVKDGRMVVFEVQVSNIALDELKERDAKYRTDGIESYWLLENFLGSSREFASRYNALWSEDGSRSGDTIPYIDHALFETGPENHLFIAQGIRSVGLHAKKPAVFTTHKPHLSLAEWVRHVLDGNYGRYLEHTAAAFHDRRHLKSLAAPALLRYRDCYRNIIRDETCHKKADRLLRIANADANSANGSSLRKKTGELYAELDWVKNEYRRFTAESYGLFTWKKIPGHDKPRLLFRLESEYKIHQLEECVATLTRWEASFTAALSNLAQEIADSKRQR